MGLAGSGPMQMRCKVDANPSSLFLNPHHHLVAEPTAALRAGALKATVSFVSIKDRVLWQWGSE